MFNFFNRARPQPPAAQSASDAPPDFTRLDRDPYLALAEPRLRLISIFDDLRYDRADMDMVSGPMRRRVAERLAPMGFRQVSGSVMENPHADVRVILPKFRALGASPFDATRDTPRRRQDYFALTPTQVACQFIDHFDHAGAVEKIKELIVKHPINLLRIMDFLDKEPAHEAFRAAIGHLTLVQREAVQSAPLKTRRALR
ncbi:MAG: hypothetical protein AAF744_00945 [Pseudomonadota bacterium]